MLIMIECNSLKKRHSELAKEVPFDGELHTCKRFQPCLPWEALISLAVGGLLARLFLLRGAPPPAGS